MLQKADADCALSEAGQRLYQEQHRSVIYKPNNHSDTHYGGNSVVW